VRAPQSYQPELSRELGFFALFATATGTMIGAGIFVLPGMAAEAAGPGAALAFLFAGAIALVAALSVSELATAMPKAGGGYYFVSRAMGPLLGTIVGLGAWLALVFKGSFALVGFGQYALHFTPVSVLAAAITVGGFLLAVNLVGTGVSGLLQNVIVIFLLGILGVFVARGAFAVDLQVLRPMVPFGWGSVMATTGLVFISYLGIEKAAAVSEEVRDPGRTVPLAILSSVATVTVLYVGVMLIVTGVLPLAEIAALPAPVADAGEIFLGTVGGVLVAVAGLLATASTGNAAILSSSRYPFAMSRDGLADPWFNRIHRRFRTPARSILVTGFIMLALVLIFDVESLAKLGGVFNIFVFALVNLAVVILRSVRPPWYRPVFRAPLYPWLQIAGALAALALIPQMGTGPMLASVGFLLAGVAWYYWHLRRMGLDGIRPRYGLIDHVRRIQQVQNLEESRRRIQEEPLEVPPDEDRSVVVELIPGAPNRHLLTVAAAVARRYECPIDVVLVTALPPQSPLTEEVEPPPRELVEKIGRRLEEHGVEMRFHHVLARDRGRAILNRVSEGTRAVFLDWRGEVRRAKLRGSHVDRVLAECQARVGVLKYRGNRDYRRLLVATAGGPYARGEVEFADAIAAHTGATITLLMVLPPGASPGRRTHAEDYLRQLDRITTVPTEVRLVEGESIEDEILEAGRDADLILLGASREPFYRGYLFGRIPHRVAQRASQSVLLTKDPGFPQLWPRHVGRLFRLFRRDPRRGK
jgi:amino acid transporter/nucleotide-binding universal stress UspA family protein